VLHLHINKKTSTALCDKKQLLSHRKFTKVSYRYQTKSRLVALFVSLFNFFINNVFFFWQDCKKQETRNNCCQVLFFIWAVFFKINTMKCWKWLMGLFLTFILPNALQILLEEYIVIKPLCFKNSFTCRKISNYLPVTGMQRLHRVHILIKVNEQKYVN
jgi:hypothetical protein